MIGGSGRSTKHLRIIIKLLNYVADAFLKKRKSNKRKTCLIKEN